MATACVLANHSKPVIVSAMVISTPMAAKRTAGKSGSWLTPNSSRDWSGGWLDRAPSSGYSATTISNIGTPQPHTGMSAESIKGSPDSNRLGATRTSGMVSAEPTLKAAHRAKTGLARACTANYLMNPLLRR
jgi:hypothetical protein